MTLEQLRIFVAVAQRQHMTAAAQALNLTQSAVSAAVAALEERHQVHLFDRVGRGIRLTAVGKLFLDEAQEVLARAAAAEAMLDDLSGLRRGALTLVASQTIAAYWLPPLLATFRARHPALAIDVAVGNTGQAADQVRSGAADIGIVEGDVDDGVLLRWPLGDDRLVLVSAGDGSAAGGTAAARGEAAMLRAARWIMREPGSGTRSTLDRHLRQLGIDPDDLDVALVLPSNESVRTAVEAGAGVAALSSLVVASSLAAGTLRALPFSAGPRTFHGLRHKERYCSAAARAFLAHLGTPPAVGEAG